MSRIDQSCDRIPWCNILTQLQYKGGLRCMGSRKWEMPHRGISDVNYSVNVGTMQGRDVMVVMSVQCRDVRVTVSRCLTAQSSLQRRSSSKQPIPVECWNSPVSQASGVGCAFVVLPAMVSKSSP